MKILNEVTRLILFDAYYHWHRNNVKFMKYFLSDNSYTTINTGKIFPSYYQNECKIYLDEYPGQKELREEYFKKEEKRNRYFNKRFMERN